MIAKIPSSYPTHLALTCTGPIPRLALDRSFGRWVTYAESGRQPSFATPLARPVGSGTARRAGSGAGAWRSGPATDGAKGAQQARVARPRSSRRPPPSHSVSPVDSRAWAGRRHADRRPVPRSTRPSMHQDHRDACSPLCSRDRSMAPSRSKPLRALTPAPTPALRCGRRRRECARSPRSRTPGRTFLLDRSGRGRPSPAWRNGRD